MMKSCHILVTSLTGHLIIAHIVIVNIMTPEHLTVPLFFLCFIIYFLSLVLQYEILTLFLSSHPLMNDNLKILQALYSLLKLYMLVI